MRADGHDLGAAQIDRVAGVAQPLALVVGRESGSQRLGEIIDNLLQRIGEATERRWLGEVQGLQISLDAAESKLTAADRINRTTTSGPTLVGLPSLLGRTETT
jgi:hypothetical protein